MFGYLSSAQARSVVARDAVIGQRPAGAEVGGDVDAALRRRVDDRAVVLERAEAPDGLRGHHPVARRRLLPRLAAVGGLVDAAAGDRRQHRAAGQDAGEHRLHGRVQLLRVLRVLLRTLRDRLEAAAARRLEQARGGARVDRRAAGEDRADVLRARDAVEAGVERAPVDAVVGRPEHAVVLGRGVHRDLRAVRWRTHGPSRRCRRRGREARASWRWPPERRRM